MRVIGTIRSTATERITVEAGSYQEAREMLEAQIPEGHELIAIRTDDTWPRQSAGQAPEPP